MAVNDYATAAEVREHVIDMGLDTSYDVVLGKLITRASRLIDLYTRRNPGSYKVDTDEIRYYHGSCSSILDTDEIATLPTTIGVAEGGIVDTDAGTGGAYTTWAITDYWAIPTNALKEGIPYNGFMINYQGTKASWYQYFRGVKITGKFGYSLTTPPLIQEGTIIQVGRWIKRGQAGFSEVAGSTQFGELRYKELDPEVKVIVQALDRFVV